ncbi:hypothetical protein ONZ51_g860 [Trametes cubensis]|uniref:Uncharacterized protein n=1 Tax=Trametes cubensis TaxID=1111947 RepID=A0AAD7U2M0_9APHY|nr:hypothetical protein ONZ51_g860 [Trametes cubensis]
MSKNLRSWYAFATDRLGIDVEMSDLIFVSGHFKTPVWAEAAFSSKTTNSELLLCAGLNNPLGSGGGGLSASFVLSNCDSPVVFHHRGPIDSDGSQSTHEDWDLSNSERTTADQCIFINYYKMKFRVAPFRPRIMKGAAGPHDLPPRDGDIPSNRSVEDVDTDTVDVSIGADNVLLHGDGLVYDEGIFDPVDGLLNYILTHSQTEAAFASDEHACLYTSQIADGSLATGIPLTISDGVGQPVLKKSSHRSARAGFELYDAASPIASSQAHARDSVREGSSAEQYVAGNGVAL